LALALPHIILELLFHDKVPKYYFKMVNFYHGFKSQQHIII